MLKAKNIIYYFGIFLVVLIWGIAPNVTQYTLRFYSPAIWNAFTSLIAVIAMLVICGKKLKNLNWDYCKVAIPTGLFYSLACIAQKTGLTMTTPAQYAFLENISCVFVPILMFLFVLFVAAFASFFVFSHNKTPLSDFIINIYEKNIQKGKIFIILVFVNFTKVCYNIIWNIAVNGYKWI